jgi:hypothetical protein
VFTRIEIVRREEIYRLTSIGDPKQDEFRHWSCGDYQVHSEAGGFGERKILCDERL